MPASDNPPDARQVLRIALEEVGQKLVLFGGSSDGSIYQNDLWEFDIASSLWTQITPVSIQSPEARIAFCIFGDSDTRWIYMFGGETKLGYQNDMWFYDPKTMKWNEVTTKGVPAPAFGRFAFASFRNSSNKLKFVVTNGLTMDGVDKDVYVYDVETSTWSHYTSNGDISGADQNSSMVYFEEKLYLFGGYNDLNVEDNTLQVRLRYRDVDCIEDNQQP
jgi:N-acetylneuraminic acid mutarotase